MSKDADEVIKELNELHRRFSVHRFFNLKVEDFGTETLKYETNYHWVGNTKSLNEI